MSKKTILTSALLLTSLNAFTPNISLNTDMSYATKNIANSEFGHLEIPAIIHGLGGHSHGGEEASAMNEDGFNLNYVELGLSADVDQLFSLTSFFHISEESIAVEEAFFTTNKLGFNTKLKGGKFRSSFGRINEKHHHTYDFAEIPLVYHGFLGSEGLIEKGLQLQKTFDLPQYLMAGVEVFAGENENSFGTGNIQAVNAEEDDIAVKGNDSPNLIVGYVKTAYDLSEDTTILGGLSVASGEHRIDHLEDEHPHALSGDTTIVGIDLSMKKYFDSYSYLSFESEILYRELDGKKYEYADAAQDSFASADLNKKQAGFYANLVYAFDKNYKIGARYEGFFKNEVNGIDKEDDLYKTSLMVEYAPSEFSKIRLQYNNNRALYNEDEERQNLHSFILQFNLSIGAHAAHAY
ncbi:MAG: Unknown protein [uncultured Campylobacterales bacterium]|uniref:Zinc-regulated TonB-dependent outer membrane receptor n=1 Tax=uncultured Campylobacterales bacterium TaxID=352960 RepID=A0A6S6STN1_9BACT|nr:MAG: Unknown protein [uncultured Campylobacterales bacterium]